MTRRYTIAVTAEQARIISQACDLLARLGIGQWPEFIKYMPEPLSFTGRHDAVQALRPVMADLLRQYSPAGAYDGYQSHLGILNELAARGAREAWDLHQVLRHRMEWDRAIAEGLTVGTTRNWTGGMMYVNYDEPMHAGSEPLAVIEADTISETARGTGGFGSTGA